MHSTISPRINTLNGRGQLYKELRDLGFDDGTIVGDHNTVTARLDSLNLDLVYGSRIGAALFRCWDKGVWREGNHIGDDPHSHWALEFDEDMPVDVVVGAITGVLNRALAQMPDNA